jgi:hypothetical protein
MVSTFAFLVFFYFRISRTTLNFIFNAQQQQFPLSKTFSDATLCATHRFRTRQHRQYRQCRLPVRQLCNQQRQPQLLQLIHERNQQPEIPCTNATRRLTQRATHLRQPCRRAYNLITCTRLWRAESSSSSSSTRDTTATMECFHLIGQALTNTHISIKQMTMITSQCRIERCLNNDSTYRSNSSTIIIKTRRSSSSNNNNRPSSARARSMLNRKTCHRRLGEAERLKCTINLSKLTRPHRNHRGFKSRRAVPASSR